MLTALCKKDLSLCTDQELYTGLLLLVKGMAKERAAARGKKKLYYISAEFLIGKLLSNNLINLGIYDNVKDILAKHGKSLSHMAVSYTHLDVYKRQACRNSRLLSSAGA